MTRVFIIVGFFACITVFLIYRFSTSNNQSPVTRNTSTTYPSPTTPPLPQQKILSNDYHIFQTFNNCGPAALSMALSYYGIVQSQAVLGEALRPYQHPLGDNDDKSVTLEELARKSTEYNLIPYHRANGSIKLLKQFIAADMPVVTRTWLGVDNDIGHYRVVKGYDAVTGEIIQDDSLQGANLRYSYDDFLAMWEKFNYEYVVLVPPEKDNRARAILGNNVHAEWAWAQAKLQAQEKLDSNPNDTYARFNLSVAMYHTQDYEGAIREFEEVETQLPWRTLWYQTEPIEAYFAVGNYTKVFEVTDTVLNNHNRAFSELYVLRGKAYEQLGDNEAAQAEFEKARQYNIHLTL
ncbi:MAG: C39 family peptidase [Candidatus Roizmanbacteria bacterium]|nr:C39 family peptidase [Candidatus Roizmanbacteria bacterium]